MAREHPRRALAEWPEPGGAVPGGGGKVLAVRRDRERRDRPGMALQHPFRLRPPEPPQGDAPVLRGAGEAPVRQRRDGVHGAVVDAQDGERSAGVEPPDDGGLIEAAGDGEPPVAGHGQRPHRPAMAAHLRRCRAGEEERGEEAEDREASEHEEPGHVRGGP